ncbi:MAG TPA: hypothetical protein VHD39_03525 [Acidimicrobiales bacterium]|nr:hypothetical protein [Acidimicrobiales bacterium]
MHASGAGHDTTDSVAPAATCNGFDHAPAGGGTVEVVARAALDVVEDCAPD